MNKKYLAITVVIFLILSSFPAMIYATTSNFTVSVDKSVAKEGESITISGTAPLNTVLYKYVNVKIINQNNVVKIFDQIENVSGNCIMTYSLSGSDWNVGSYTIYFGVDKDFATTTFEIASTVTPTPSAIPTPTTEPGHGGGSGGGIKPSSDIKTEGSTTILTLNSQGAAVSSVDNTKMQQAIDSAKQNGSKVLQIEVAVSTTTVGATAIGANVPAQLLASASASGIETVEVKTELATISIKTNSLASEITSTSQKVELTVAKVDTTKMTAADVDALAKKMEEKTGEKLGTHPIYDFNANVDGKKVSSFTGDKPVKISIPYALGVNEDAQKVVIYYIADNGELTVMKNCVYDPATQRVSFTTNHFSKYFASQAAVTFSDINSIAWAKDSINALAAREIIAGMGEGKFAPNDKVTRAQFIKMLVNAFDLLDTTATTTFTDVSSSAWYYSFVASAKKAGITSGYPDGTFGVDKPITRQEMATLAFRTSKIAKLNLQNKVQPIQFSDKEQIQQYAEEAISSMQQAGIINGDAGKFMPSDNTTRAQAAKIIFGLFTLLQ